MDRQADKGCGGCVQDVWQAPLSSAEGLGRLAWILECTTSTEVLERT
jgi:hypothetical protein